jgi:RNA polymerase sigma factor (sigma-70 family)
MMNDDMELVREYAAHQSEQAFETLVSRHLGLVHSAALRQVRDPSAAEEITQTVFIILARKAAALSPKTILPGWLYRTTRYVSAASVKIQRRRERREKEAHMLAATDETPTDLWERLSPILDESMAELRGTERDAIVLRYFQNKSLRDVGVALGVGEYAAQKRVERALDKLRQLLAKRGVVSTTAVIAGAIHSNSVQAISTVQAAAVASAAIAKGATASSSTLTLIQSALKIMAWTKIKTAALIIAAFTLTAGTAAVMLQSHDQPEMIYKGKTITAWIKQMYDNENDMTAHFALVDIGEPAIPYLVRELTADRKSVCAKEPLSERLRCRSDAAHVLGKLGPKAYVAIPGMISALSEKKYQPLPFAAAVGLGEIGPAATNAIPALVETLTNEDFNVRMEAASALAKIGQITPTTVAGLEPLLRDRLPEVRMRASIALWRATPDDPVAAARVNEFLLQSTNVSIRSWTAWLLGDLAPITTNFIPSLETALNDTDANVRSSASSSLKKLKAP